MRAGQPGDTDQSSVDHTLILVQPLIKGDVSVDGVPQRIIQSQKWEIRIQLPAASESYYSLQHVNRNMNDLYY